MKHSSFIHSFTKARLDYRRGNATGRRKTMKIEKTGILVRMPGKSS
jgi:hypothetical protein